MAELDKLRQEFGSASIAVENHQAYPPKDPEKFKKWYEEFKRLKQNAIDASFRYYEVAWKPVDGV